MKRNHILRYFILLAEVLIASGGFAQVRISQSIPDAVPAKRTFHLSYSVNSTKNIGANEIHLEFPSNINNLTILFKGGLTQSSSMSMTVINGKSQSNSSYSSTFTYTVKANKEGNVVIPSFTINVKGKDYKTSAKTIKILKTGAGGTTQTNAQQPDDDIYDLFGDTQEQVKLPKIGKNSFFLRTEVENKNPYEDQGVYIVTKLYFDPRVRSISANSIHFPDYKDVIVQNVDRSLSPQQTVIHGKTVGVAIVRESILIPQRSGKLVISPTTIDANFDVESLEPNDPFGIFSSGIQTVNRKLSSQPITLNIKPLPSPQPQNYISAVGSYQMSAKISSPPYETGSPISIMLTMKGSGNIKFIAEPKIDLPKSFEKYPTRDDSNLEILPTGTKGTRTFEYVFVPNKKGKFTIPPISISYFDPTSHSYKQLSTGGYSIEVQQGSTALLVSSGSAKSKGDIAPNKPIQDGHFSCNNQTHYLLRLLIGYVILAVLILLVYYCLRRRIAILRNPEARKRSKAAKEANRRLKKANEYKNAEKTKAFYDEMHQAIIGYLSDKLGLDASELMKTEISSKLSYMSVDDQTIQDVMTLLHDSEYARFAPGADSKDRMQDHYDTTLRLISQIEDQIIMKIEQ